MVEECTRTRKAGKNKQEKLQTQQESKDARKNHHYCKKLTGEFVERMSEGNDCKHI